ncbi:MuDR family transposase, partial [Striga hermonthica]
YFVALQRVNPNTAVDWEFQGGDVARHVPDREFKYVFWAFGPAIRTFEMCPPVISVDGTHLCGHYKRKLLVVVAQTANKRLLPVAYALVDEESTGSRSFFLRNLRRYVVFDKQICVLSDRDVGLRSAIESLPDWQEPAAYHRICLRHLRSNVVTRSKKIRDWCWELGSQLSKQKFRQTKQRLQEFNSDAYNYLFNIPLNQWTLYRDEKRRWGTLTTNMSESYNNVLKGVRFLPCRALVEATFKKLWICFDKNKTSPADAGVPLLICTMSHFCSWSKLPHLTRWNVRSTTDR